MPAARARIARGRIDVGRCSDRGGDLGQRHLVGVQRALPVVKRRHSVGSPGRGGSAFGTSGGAFLPAGRETDQQGGHDGEMPGSVHGHDSMLVDAHRRRKRDHRRTRQAQDLALAASELSPPW